jgi:hypothetical protein
MSITSEPTGEQVQEMFAPIMEKLSSTFALFYKNPERENYPFLQRRNFGAQFGDRSF